MPLNFVVLTAALSVYNSCVYATSRMLFSMAEQGNAPRRLGKVDKRRRMAWFVSISHQGL
ncbi:hypothetical protein ABH313_07385 [Chromobacterium vaccinii]|uniref:hypothetical protein n=1 Tax=Chromobacterium vaccinii TaxID=1108595 RepID=UPI003261A605